MRIKFCAKLNFSEGEYAIMQNIGFLLSWVGNPCRYLVLHVRPCKIRTDFVEALLARVRIPAASNADLYSKRLLLFFFFCHVTKKHESRTRCYGGRSRGVFGTLTYPHLIVPYLAYYGHLASYYGGPWCSHIRCWCY